MSEALKRLDESNDISELPGIKIAIDAEYQAEKILMEINKGNHLEHTKSADDYRTMYRLNESNMRKLDSSIVIGVKYVQLLGE